MARNHDDVEEPELNPPTVDRVARRALALTALANCAQMDSAPDPKAAARDAHDILDWLAEERVLPELEPWEDKFLRAPVGKRDRKKCIEVSYFIEAVCVLAWALQKFELPPHDTLVEVPTLLRALGYRQPQALAALMKPGLRRPDDIAKMSERVFALHWRLRDFQLAPKAIDFVKFAKESWFGPLDISGLPLIGKDLALQQKRIDKCNPDVVGMSAGIAHERHQAINWLLGFEEIYSEVDTST